MREIFLREVFEAKKKKTFDLVRTIEYELILKIYKVKTDLLIIAFTKFGGS